jgi:predicted nucleic acid-binding Zn ribbon protein
MSEVNSRKPSLSKSHLVCHQKIHNEESLCVSECREFFGNNPDFIKHKEFHNREKFTLGYFNWTVSVM